MAARAAQQPERRQAAQPAPGPDSPPRQQQPGLKLLQRLALGGAALTASAALLLTPSGSALAADSASVGTCLLQNCQAALANCLADTTCVENLVCLQLCNGTPDETACQIRCGDRYTDEAINAFNSCVISEKKCVPQKVDVGLFPVPPECALDNKFDLAGFQGRWYITAGLNDLFDTFPCQEHFFASPEEGSVYAKINWRIPLMDPLTGEADFADRSTMQRFVQQDPATPAILFNGGNEFLHYEDTWYVLASKPDEYVFIYYRGNNDAWQGYGGATVYTRENSLPEDYVPELQAAAEKAGLDWSQFKLTDNTCPAHPPQRSLKQRLALGAQREVALVTQLAGKKLEEVEYGMEDNLRSFGKGFTVLERDVASTLRAEESRFEEKLLTLSAEAQREAEELEKEAKEAARMIKRFEMEASMGPWINWIPQSWRPIIMPLPLE